MISEHWSLWYLNIDRYDIWTLIVMISEHWSLWYLNIDRYDIWTLIVMISEHWSLWYLNIDRYDIWTLIVMISELWSLWYLKCCIMQMQYIMKCIHVYMCATNSIHSYFSWQRLHIFVRRLAYTSTGGDGPCIHVRMSIDVRYVDVRFSAIFHGRMAVIKAYFLVDKSSIT